MGAIIKRLGMSDEEVNALGPVEGKSRKRFVRMSQEIYHTPLPTDIDIDELEKRFGEFPVEYRKFLLRYNGGIPIPNTIVTNNNERVVNFFFPIKSPANYPEDFQVYWDEYGSRIPRGVLPIASAGGGDLILIVNNGINFGKVYYWDHNFESERDASNYFDNVELIADSFDLLLNSFCDISDPEEGDVT